MDFFHEIYLFSHQSKNIEKCLITAKTQTFTKHCEKIQKFRETGNLKHLYRNELDKVVYTRDTSRIYHTMLCFTCGERKVQ